MLAGVLLWLVALSWLSGIGPLWALVLLGAGIILGVKSGLLE